MSAPETIRSLEAHKRWLGYLQPDGLVVSAAALVDKGHYYNEAQRQRQIEFIDHLRERQHYDEENGTVEITDFKALATDFLQWPAQEWIAAADLPDRYHLYLKESGENLSPLAALHLPRSQRQNLPEDQPPYQILLFTSGHQQEDFDAPYETIPNTWLTSATRRFERLLRETGVPIGLLLSKTALRLVYAPQGENPGHLTFRYADMLSTMGRPILGSFELLLGRNMLFLGEAKNQLPALLRHSRSMQASVSTQLAEQVLEALYELVRGFQAADARVHGDLLRGPMARNPDDVYHGLLTVLLRLVFLLFAEDRGLLPSSPLFNQHYSLHALFERLNRDAALHHDTMDQRFGAWPQLLALFRLIHGGHRHRDLQMPAREGHLFDPDRFPFLEGRADAREDVRSAENRLPTVADGVIWRILGKLLILRGERLSYRTLDVEQIGSVYQTMIGFTLEVAQGTSIALKPAKSKGAPAFINLDDLLATPPAKRAEFLQKSTDHKLTGKAATALKDAATPDDLLAALEKKIARQASPEKLPPGSYLLQPTDERRRSGSHYTPRALTAPIVKKTLEPILTRLGEKPTPQQILDLKVCDPAVGSGAFLVEACRQLGDALVAAWAAHGDKPVIPPDEDELLHARRLVAQRCLYGVDRNPMATDLAKLSLWLATLAKDHPFTFLDHSLRTGDALVGLSKQQIIDFHWLDRNRLKQNLKKATSTKDQKEIKRIKSELAILEDRIFGQTELEKTMNRVMEHRQKILDGGDDMFPADKADRLARADKNLNPIRRAGDLCLAAFFAGDKPKARAELREQYLEALLECDPKHGFRPEKIEAVGKLVNQLRKGESHSVTPFHWEIEFPEVFVRENGGFDAFVGNPPFVGGSMISSANGDAYKDWLYATFAESGNRMDLVAYFFRHAFAHLRANGSLGFIATNSIAQGDTRQGGLRYMCMNGATIYAATRRYRWPGIAAVVVAVVHVAKGTIAPPFSLDGMAVDIITAYLFHEGLHENPAVLKANAGKSFKGVETYGQGFLFDDDDAKSTSRSEMQRLMLENSKNTERISPYIGGEEINSSPTQSPRRFVVNFSDFPLRRSNLGLRWCDTNEDQRNVCIRTGIVPLDYPMAVAEDWPDLLAIVETKVKPEREKKSKEVANAPWWKFWRIRQELAEASSGLSHVLAVSRVGNQLAFARIPTGIVISESAVIFPLEQITAFTFLQSRIHEAWTRFFASSMKDDLRYTPTDCFETFPFPPDWETNEALEKAGQEYYEFRADLMVRHNEGLTKTYNRFHHPEETDPGILRLRELHAAMDHAVLAAYGWSDLVEQGRTVCEFIPDYYDEPAEEGGDPIPKSIRYRWPDTTRDEVLARLLKLNAERHAEEVRQGLHTPAAKKTTKKRAKTQDKLTAPSQPSNLPQQQAFKFPADDLDIFQVAAHAPSLRELPTGSRQREEDPQIYATALVAAILSEANGELPWSRLRDAYILATSPLLMQSHALPEERARVSAWKQVWNELAGPEHLLQGVLNLGGKNLAVDSSPSGEPIFQLQDGFVPNIEPHVGYDAWLALRISEPLSPGISLDVGNFDMQNLNQQILELVA